MSDSPSTSLLPANPIANVRAAPNIGVAGAISSVSPQPSPENPDTFTGLLARFDAYLAQLQKAESALEEHADKLVIIDPDGPARPTPMNMIGDDKSNSVIRRLQARVDRLSALVSAISRHQERADRAF